MTHPLFRTEGDSITAFFKQNNIKAKVDWTKSREILTGYFRFALTLAPTELFSAIESRQRELTAVLAENRRKQGLSLEDGFQVLPTAVPFPSLETPHPTPVTLWANNALIFNGEPHTMLLGRSYLYEPRDEVALFDKNPHFLVAGITNAGKSVLLQNMVLSLAARTRPQDVRLFLIDLKNEDLAPLATLPHVEKFAGTAAEAMNVLEELRIEKEARIADPNRKPFRIVCVIDEMAQLAQYRQAVKNLGDLASIGRSKDINLIGATQHPTREGGMGSLLKANFGDRQVGQVAPGQSQYATNRGGTHAELLPGKGSFLRCVQANVYRFQSYYIDEKQGHVRDLVKAIRRLHSPITRLAPAPSQEVVAPTLPASRPVEVVEQVVEQVDSTGGNGVVGVATSSGHVCNSVDQSTGFFPIDTARALTAEEAAELRRLVNEGELNYRDVFSLNKAQLHVYGKRSPERSAWIKEALG